MDIESLQFDLLFFVKTARAQRYGCGDSRHGRLGSQVRPLTEPALILDLHKVHLICRRVMVMFA